MAMKLFTKEIRQQLVSNGRKQDAVRGTPQEIDFAPVVKLFTPDANCTWLLTEIDTESPEIAFGLCDLGFQCPELGSVYLPELQALRGRLGLPIERDLHFKATHPLTVYADAARLSGGITENAAALAQAAAAQEAERCY
jgi:hypothetical protein